VKQLRKRVEEQEVADSHANETGVIVPTAVITDYLKTKSGKAKS
jgi:hypothetical protein